MLTPPDDLPVDTLRQALVAGWALAPAAMTYRPVGFGTHHWEVVDADGRRWFVNVDDLDVKKHTADESPERTAERLRSPLTAAAALRRAGRNFVVAPVPDRTGGLVVPVPPRYAMAVYPFVAGESFTWGELATDEHRRAVLDMVIGVHAAPPEVRRIAWPDQFVVPQLDQVLAALDGRGDGDGSGPYGRAAAELVTRHAGAIRRMLDQYDDLVRRARADPDRAVLTHGEPHRANTMRTGDGWVLIDWETARVAPPERDLWALDPGDGSVLAAYAAATGVVPRPEILRLYRLRWQVADLAIDLARFRRPHTGSEDDAASWRILTEIIEALAGGSPER